LRETIPSRRETREPAFLSAVDFLEINGYRIEVSDDEFFLGRLIVEVLEQKLDEARFAGILRSLIHEI
jgi:prophage maintenance system killer protein